MQRLGISSFVVAARLSVAQAATAADLGVDGVPSKAGGRGTFLEFDVPSPSGHFLIGYPDLWTEPVGTYLQAIGASGKK